MDKAKQNDIHEEAIEADLPTYEPPQVVTYYDSDLLAELGPARACSFSGSVVGCPTEYQQWLRDTGYPVGLPDP